MTDINQKTQRTGNDPASPLAGDLVAGLATSLATSLAIELANNPLNHTAERLVINPLSGRLGYELAKNFISDPRLSLLSMRALGAYMLIKASQEAHQPIRNTVSAGCKAFKVESRTYRLIIEELTTQKLVTTLDTPLVVISETHLHATAFGSPMLARTLIARSLAGKKGGAKKKAIGSAAFTAQSLTPSTTKKIRRDLSNISHSLNSVTKVSLPLAEKSQSLVTQDVQGSKILGSSIDEFSEAAGAGKAIDAIDTTNAPKEIEVPQAEHAGAADDSLKKPVKFVQEDLFGGTSAAPEPVAPKEKGQRSKAETLTQAGDAGSEKEQEQGQEKDIRVVVPYAKIREMYNDNCKSLPSTHSVSEWSVKRKHDVKMRWTSKPNLEFWEAFFKDVEMSDFLTGRTSEFMVRFDWLFNATNFMKINEGNYKNRGGRHAKKLFSGEDKFQPGDYGGHQIQADMPWSPKPRNNPENSGFAGDNAEDSPS